MLSSSTVFPRTPVEVLAMAMAGCKIMHSHALKCQITRYLVARLCVIMSDHAKNCCFGMIMHDHA